MTIEAVIFTRLSTHAGVSALVSNRISPVDAPQNDQMPAITHRQLSGPPIRVMGGVTGLVRAIFQFDCWSGKRVDGTRGTPDEAKALARQVILALEGWNNTVGTVVQYATLVGGPLDLAPEENGALYHVEVEFEIFYEE